MNEINIKNTGVDNSSTVGHSLDVKSAAHHVTDTVPEATEIWGNESERKKTLNSLSPEKFDEMLEFLNAKLRRKDPETHQYDGQSVYVSADFVSDDSDLYHNPPDQEDKRELLHYALTVAQSLPNVQDAALLLSAAIN